MLPAVQSADDIATDPVLVAELLCSHAQSVATGYGLALAGFRIGPEGLRRIELDEAVVVPERMQIELRGRVAFIQRLDVRKLVARGGGG